MKEKKEKLCQTPDIVELGKYFAQVPDMIGFKDFVSRQFIATARCRKLTNYLRENQIDWLSNGNNSKNGWHILQTPNP